MLKNEIWACQRDVSNLFEEEELGWNKNERMEERDDSGLPWVAISKLEAAKHSLNFL